MKNEYPTMPESMKKQLNDLVREKVNQPAAVVSKKHRFGKKTVILVAAIAAALAAVTVGADGLARLREKSAGAYGSAVSVDTTGAAAPDALQEVRIAFTALPDGYSYEDAGEKASKDVVQKINGSQFDYISAYGIYMDKNGTMDADALVGNVKSSQKVTVGDHEAVVYRTNSTTHGDGRTIGYVLYPEYWMVVEILGQDDVTDEELETLMNGLTVTPTGNTLNYDEVVTWSAHNTPDASGSGDGRIYKLAGTLGDSIDYTTFAGDGIYDLPMRASVTEVRAYDTLAPLGDSIPEEWKKDVEPDGKLVDDTLNYYIEGDGINTVDQLVKTENVKQKLVWIAVNFTNESDKDVKNVEFSTELERFMINEKGGLEETAKYLAYIGKAPTMKGFVERYGYDTITATGNGVSSSLDSGWFDVRLTDGSENGSNYIPRMKAGETVTVHFAWIVDEDDLPNLYLNINAVDGDAGSNPLISLGSAFNTAH